MPSETPTPASKSLPLVDGTVLAMWKVGFIQPIDGLLLIVGAGSTFTFGIWCLAQGHVTLAAYVVYFSVINLLGLAWVILLGFRACWFSLKTRANLELLPQQAAAVLHNYLKQGVSEAKSEMPDGDY